MIPVEKKSELLLREDRPKVIIYEFFNTIGAQQAFSRAGARVSNVPTPDLPALAAEREDRPSADHQRASDCHAKDDGHVRLDYPPVHLQPLSNKISRHPQWSLSANLRSD
jgi:hypothetical protein